MNITTFISCFLGRLLLQEAAEQIELEQLSGFVSSIFVGRLFPFDNQDLEFKHG